MIGRSKSTILLVAIVILVAVAFFAQYLRSSELFSSISELLEVRLRLAACNGDTRKVKQLLMLGVNVNAKNDEGYSALMDVEACKGDKDPSRVELVELLITNGAAVDLRSSKGRTALMYAARNGDTPAVNVLLKSRASVNTADYEGETALMKAAASSCNEETVRALISAGADVTARDNKGRDALDCFRSSGACPDSNVGDLLQRTRTENSR